MATDPGPVQFDLASAARSLADLGFLASPDLPDRPGPAYVLVGLREAPTFRHYDPESITYWASEGDRGVRRTLTRTTSLPIDTEFSWGVIEIEDRLHVTNEFLTFGGQLSAGAVDGVVIAVFTSPAPLLRRGGHSQVWDPGADNLGAYFARLMVPIDYSPGFERRAARADPVTRYAAFVADAMVRYRRSPSLRTGQGQVWSLLQAEERRLCAEHPAEWAAGDLLRPEAGV